MDAVTEKPYILLQTAKNNFKFQRALKEHKKLERLTYKKENKVRTVKKEKKEVIDHKCN